MSLQPQPQPQPRGQDQERGPPLKLTCSQKVKGLSGRKRLKGRLENTWRNVTMVVMEKW